MNITIDVSSAVAGIQNYQRHFKGALSKSLTQTAVQAQNAVKQSLRESFILRNAFTEHGVVIEPSTEATLTASVKFTRPYMILQEKGGIKISGKGKYVAVPLAPELKRSVIPKTLRPAWLLRNADLNGGPSRIPGKRAAATYGIAWILQTGGKHYIVSRVRPGPRGLKFWYLLVPAVHIPERLRMYETVLRTAQQNLAKNLRYNLQGYSDLSCSTFAS